MVFETRRGRVTALEDISLEIPDGHFACLVGPSGCSKSTLLRIMAGLLRPSEGVVGVGGRPVERPGADRGMVFQSYTLFPWLKVRENVEFGPKLQGLPRAARGQTSGERHRRTIAFVTHYVEEAVFLGDTIYVMSPRPGRIQEVVQVDVSRPRSLEDERLLQLRRRILSQILGEGAEAAASA